MDQGASGACRDAVGIEGASGARRDVACRDGAAAGLPELKAIVAVCDDWGIGLDGGMVVANRADMRHFVACTSGHAVIMGRRTLESFPGGRPLKNRRNIVLTRDASFAREGVDVAHSIDEALACAAGEDEAWVIGGAEVYRQLLPLCSEAVVTRNRCVRPADAYFPDLEHDSAWRLADVDGGHVIQPGEGDEGVRYDFETYMRVPGGEDASPGSGGSMLDGLSLGDPVPAQGDGADVAAAGRPRGGA